MLLLKKKKKNSTAINICTDMGFSWVGNLGGLLTFMIISCLTYEEAVELFSKVVVLFYVTTYEDSSFSMSSPTTSDYSLFSGYVVEPHCGFNLHFSDD